MPWANKVSGILEAWYAGSRGADAVANVLFGEVNPCAKLPITFPLRDTDMPQPAVVKPTSPSGEGPSALAHLAALFGGPGKERPPAQLYYNEGMLVGYKWYDAKRKAVLFPFGFGLSYTKFHYSGLRVKVDGGVSVNFTIKNTGNRTGAEVAGVYASLPPSAGEPPKRLIGWQKAQLNPGESKQVSVRIQTHYLSIFDVGKDEWSLVPGEYTIFVGGSSENLPLRQRVRLGKYRKPPNGGELGVAHYLYN
jgi:beta-glucosidase